jgi:predicted branched-subunit amino acid permease
VLVDESFGLTVDASRRGIDDLVGYKAAIDLQLYTAWMAGTAIGVFVGPVIDPVALGIEVLFPLLFLGLAVPLLRTRRHWVAAGSAVVFAILATLVLPEAWQVTAAAVLAALVGALIGD